MKKREKRRWWIMLWAILLVANVGMPAAPVWAEGDDVFDSGTGSRSNPFIISTAEQLYALSAGQAQYLNSHFRLSANIDFTDWDWEEEPWAPVGDDSGMFAGSFDGNGYTIRKLSIDLPDESSVGMFGVIADATIKQVVLEEVKVRASHTAGALAGRSIWGAIVESCSASGTIEGNDGLGGLVGYNGATSTIQSSSSAVYVKGNNSIGGLLGINHYNGIVQGSFTSGKVEGNQNTGGLIGENYSSIQSSFSTSDVTGGGYVGGLIGRMYSDSNPNVEIIVEDSYAAGKVQGGVYSGALVGYTSSDRITVQDSYWNSTANPGKSAVGGGYGTHIGLIGLTEEQMKRQTSFTGFDFAGRWAILEGVDFPYLKHSSQLSVTSPADPFPLSYHNHSYRITLEGSLNHTVSPEEPFSLHLILSNADDEKVAEGVVAERMTSGSFQKDIELSSFFLAPGQTLTIGNYTLWIWAANAARGTSPALLKLEVVPAAPDELQAIAGVEEVTLIWDAVNDTDSYNVYRYAGSEAVPDPANSEDWSKVANEIQETTTTVSGLTVGIRYHFVVTAQRDGVESKFSDVASATPQALPSNDARLSMVYLDGEEIAGFQRDTISYALDVPHTTSQITVTASVYDQGADYTVKGRAAEGVNQALEAGHNLIELIVTAGDQATTSTYRININRLNPPPPSSEEPSAGGPGSGSGSNPDERLISPHTDLSFTLGGIQFDIASGAVSEFMTLRVEALPSNGAAWYLPGGSILAGNVFEITKSVRGSFHQPITITLPFDLETYPPNQYDLALYWLDEKSNEWVMLDDIMVDGEKGQVSGRVDHFTKFAVLAAVKITDEEDQPVALLRDIEGHWAENDILALVQRGAIKGYEDRTFRPEQPITRAEFAAILVQTMELAESEDNIFEDTVAHWSKGWIATAYRNGIVNGYSESIFGPNDPVTREQMAVMIAHAFPLTDQISSVMYTDRHQISVWAEAALARVSAAGILSGYKDGSMRPQAHATRAEAVTALRRALSV